MKYVWKVLFITLISCICFMVVSALVPYSPEFKELSSEAGVLSAVGLFINNLWLTLTIYYITKHSPWSGKKLFWGTVFPLFMVYSFMTQIETWFFGSAFAILSKLDIILIALTNTTPILVGALLIPKTFKHAGPKEHKKHSFDRRDIAFKTGILGLSFMLIYFIFGYYVAWQSPELRVFYEGSTLKLGFIAKLVVNFKEQPIIYPFQFVRGVIFTLSVLPLWFMFKTENKKLLISLCLIYASIGIVLVIPNVLFPNQVRWVHFIELISSMLTYATLSWYVLSKLQLPKVKQ